MTREHLFDELDALAPEQIEAGLAAGVWGDDARSTVEHYVLKRKFAADKLDAAATAQTVAKLALDEAVGAKLWAIAAFIVAGGGMLAAMAAAFIAFMALRHGTISW